jgi:hypothetical protein
MDSKSLKEKVNIARDAVEGLEEPLKSEGFKTILSKLLNNENSPKKIISKNILKSKTGNSKSEILEEDLPLLNRTSYPQIILFKNTLERSLFILKIFRDDKGVDGLTVVQISKILTDTFRIKTSKESVSMALMNATKEVDRIAVPKLNGGKDKYMYKIMKGEEDLIEGKLKNES